VPPRFLDPFPVVTVQIPEFGRKKRLPHAFWLGNHATTVRVYVRGTYSTTAKVHRYSNELLDVYILGHEQVILTWRE
jgi:hypothetical protein